MAAQKAEVCASSPFEFPCGSMAMNRLVKAPMYEHLSNFLGGPPNAYHFALYSSWSRQGWGMVVTGNVQVSGTHLTLGRDLVVPEQLDQVSLKPYKTLADAIKGPEGRTLAIMQLSHAGRQSSNFIGGRYPFQPPLAPSAIPVGSTVSQSDPVAAMIQNVLFQTPKEMSHEDIDEVVKSFVKGARLAYDSGFDGIELHVAHGYLLAQFLSPKSNRRQDEYSLRSEHGLRLLHKIVDAIRAIAPPRFIIGVKLNASDYLSDASGNKHDRPLDPEEIRALQHILTLANWGTIDFIDISGGDYENPDFMKRVGTKNGHRQAFFARFSQRALKALDSAGYKYPSRPAIVLTGGFRTPSLIQSALRSGQTNMIGIGRCSVVCPRIPEIMYEFDQGKGSGSGDTLFGMEPDLSTPKFLKCWPFALVWDSLNKVKLVGAGLNTGWYVIVLRRTAIAELQDIGKTNEPSQAMREPDYQMSVLDVLFQMYLWMSSPSKKTKFSGMPFKWLVFSGLISLLLLILLPSSF